jgi:molybdopterin synthase sulfur carrier subunit
MQSLVGEVKLKVIVKFLGPITREDVVLEVQSDSEIKEKIKKYIDKKWLDSLAVAVNDKIVHSFDEVKDGDVISLLPPVCGG